VFAYHLAEKLGGMTVNEMLERMTSTEFTYWIAHYSPNLKGKQAPEQIKSALAVSLAAGRKKKR
jgi:hypothetical protein